jgi:hypothetical protein
MSGTGKPANNQGGAQRKNSVGGPAAAALAKAAANAAGNRSRAAAAEGKAADKDDSDPAGESDNDAEADAQAGRDYVSNIEKQMKAMREELDRMKQTQQPPQQQASGLGLDAASAAPSPPPAGTSNDVAALVRAFQESQMRQAAQQLVLQRLGELPTFSGKGSDTTLIAHEWLQRAERYFAIREKALSIDATLGDEARMLDAAYALQDDARRWYDALPSPPLTWITFKEAIKARFCSVPSERIRVDRLREFVDKAAKLRDKLNVQGMQAFTARFAQLAGEVSDRFLTDHGRLELLARGLPQRYAEVVMKEDAKEPPPPLHQVINAVLARASQKEQAASYGGASAMAASAAPINLDAISLAVATFGWSREEAQQHLRDSEGWTPHDTHGNPPAHQGAAPASAAFDKLLINALARIGAGPAGRDRNQSRRTVPGGVAKDIPADLAKARQEAGLCIKCGIVKYEGGSKGHNSRTCKSAADKTTSAAEGLKKANF